MKLHDTFMESLRVKLNSASIEHRAYQQIASIEKQAYKEIAEKEKQIAEEEQQRYEQRTAEKELEELSLKQSFRWCNERVSCIYTF